MLDAAVSVFAHISKQFQAKPRFLLTLACLLAISMSGRPQSPAATGQATNAAKPTAQQVQPVTTTIVVHGEVKDDYLSDAISVGTLDGTTLKETPLSVTVVTRDLLTDQAARLLSDVIKNDASIGEDYAPVGYYGDYEIRGFPIDLATGLEIDGMTTLRLDQPTDGQGAPDLVSSGVRI